MEKSNKQDALGKLCSLREIPKWAERYARNRTLPVLVHLGLIAAIMAICSAVTLYAVGSKVNALIIASIVFNALVTAGLLYMMLSGRWMAIIHWPGRVEGTAVPASLSIESDRRSLRLGWLSPLPLVAMLVLAVLLRVPEQYWQPLTAIYVAPAVVYIVSRDGWTEWPYLLWPVLYALHALMIVAGARLYIGVWYMDVFVPLGVYAIAGLAAAHIYSRCALRRLRELAGNRGSEGE